MLRTVLFSALACASLLSTTSAAAEKATQARLRPWSWSTAPSPTAPVGTRSSPS
ncbi:hypothetical protein [Lysobacter gummosus]|uniref:hypothetical protein n=1 Tax=Lysobacter gummosus TaxID=262324 RepID=UPI003637D153